MSGLPERPPKVSVPKEEITLTEPAKPFKVDLVVRALEGRSNKDVNDVLKGGREVGRGILKLGKRLSSLEGRAPDAWHEVMARVQTFDIDFIQELNELITQLKEHPIDGDSKIDQHQFSELVKVLETTRGHAHTAFEERKFYAKNHDRPIKKVRYVPKNFRTKNRFELLPTGLEIARGRHSYAFENIEDPSPEEVAKQVEARRNSLPEHKLRDTTLETLKSMQMRLAEFLKVRDYLPEDRHTGELTSIQIIDRMKREYDLVQEAIERLEEFEHALERIDSMEEYRVATAELPEHVVEKSLDTKISKGWVYKEQEDHMAQFPNPDKKISDKEKARILTETQSMLVRLDNLSNAYRTVLETLKDKKI